MNILFTILLSSVLLKTSFFSYAVQVHAASAEELNVLVIYSSRDGHIDEHQRSLDMLIGHFTRTITFKSSQEVIKEDLEDITHLFYYGQVPEKLPASFQHIFDDYVGVFTAIGYNSEHLGDHFSFIEPLHERVVEQLQFRNNTAKKWEIIPEFIIEVQAIEENEIIVEGKEQNSETIYPVVMKNKQHYFIAMDNFYGFIKIMMGEVFHDIFGVNHKEERPAYIRLEDIHPLVDPKNVKEIVEVLKEKDIPFMMAVIPVYTNPETGQQFHFSDSPKLLKVLKEAQRSGGSVVLHGYTHQYRESETGEGFEFWDVENNTPVYAEADESFTLRTEDEFISKDAYDQYMEDLTLFETNYIKRKITRGIQELSNYGLYPLAFEAPHYTMSQNGYRVVSEFFSTYVGQIQLSDENWEIMDSTPYSTMPNFLHGMELLPETLGYVVPEDENAIAEILYQAESFGKTNDGMLAAFYHPYLGVERFIELIEQMETLQGISWIDLKDQEIWVKADHVYLSTQDGEIVPVIDKSKLFRTSIDFPIYHLNRLVHLIFWVIAGVGSGAIVLFIGFAFFFSTNRMKMEG